MPSIIHYKYDKNVISQIRQWKYGENWPTVYIIFNTKKAYIGETLDSIRRTEQHLAEPDFQEFTDICLISDKTFNKSVILDLESFLIKYMAADDAKELTNSNAGIVNHNYFYREAYEDEFIEVWNAIQQLGIVNKSIQTIENSELFKYSPYKALNKDQQEGAYEILKRLSEINDASEKTIIQVIGGAGTGKTILAVYLVKLIVDINRNKKVWYSIGDADDAVIVKKLAHRLCGIRKIGFVVPMVELRQTMVNIFRSVDGLSEGMVLAPEDVVNSYYDVLIVDEAHRLYRRKHLPSGQLYTKFDAINTKLMGKSCRKCEDDLTELDWIIKSSRLQILFYDVLQTIRVPDIGKDRFSAICRPHLYKCIELSSQMRCRGGTGYYEYIKTVLYSVGLDIHRYQSISNYNLHVCDNILELFAQIQKSNDESSLCRVIAGPGWKINDEIIIEGNIYHWATNKDILTGKASTKTISSIHQIQGFDLNMAGVIFGKEIYYNLQRRRIEINKQELMDNFTKSNGDEEMRQYVLNIYLTLMTRGINGTYVYAIDQNLRDYLKQFFN